MTASHRLLTQAGRQGRKTLSLIGASLLALALTATTPALAADTKPTSETAAKAKTATKAKTDLKASSSKAADTKTRAKKSSDKSEVASAKDGDGKTAKKSSDSDKKTTKTADASTAKGKTASKSSDSKSTKDKTDSKLADAGEKSSKGSAKDTKSSKTKASAAKSKLAEADEDEDTAKPGNKSSKASSSKTSKSKLADAGTAKGKKRSAKGGKDIDKKAKAEGRTSKLADGSVKKSKKGKKEKAEPKPVPDKAMLTLAAALANEARTEVPVNLTSGPVPYARATPAVLSPEDAQLYRTAYAQIDAGDYGDAEATLARVTDKSLVGHVKYRKLFSGDYTASYDELVAWTSQYGDLPMAMRVWNLAKRKKPDGAPDPAFPSLMGRPGVVASGTAVPGVTASAMDSEGAGVQLASTGTLAPTVRADLNPGAPMSDAVDSDLTPKSARSAYNNGQLEQAVTLGKTIGDHWVAGLASYRLKRFDQAIVHFKFVSTDPSRNAWSQSSGAYWAARSALRMNDAATADTYFKIAASYPFTFYGLLAEARLGVTPAIALAKKGLPPTFQADTGRALAASLNSNSNDWAKTNPQAQRMSAFVQLGRMNDARDEVRSAMQTASDDTMRQKWMALAVSHNIPVGQMKSTDRLFNADLYPIPDYALSNAKVDRALVYAFARKESKFNAGAKSYAGAYGLMQIMPGTAALVEGNSSYTKKPNQLLKAETNLRIGQKYIQRLMDTKATEGDLLRTIAAYNAGPGPVKDAMDSLGNDYDSLLVMESIPVAQTRQYIEEVAANYWIYRQIMGKETPSLLQAANDARIIDASADALDAEDEIALLGTD